MKITFFVLVLLIGIFFFLISGVQAGLIKNSGKPDLSEIQFSVRSDPTGNFTTAHIPSSQITTAYHPGYYDEILARARAKAGADPSYGGQYAQGTVSVKFTASVQEGNDRIDDGAASSYYDPNHPDESFSDYWNNNARSTIYEDYIVLSGYIKKFAKSFAYQSGMTL